MLQGFFAVNFVKMNFDLKLSSCHGIIMVE